MAAFRANAAAMASRAAGKPIRLASKSVRCRHLIAHALGLAGFHGILAYALPEALWLTATGTSDDIVVGYPTADRRALTRLAGDPAAAAAITVMVDSIDHLDLIEKVTAAGLIRSQSGWRSTSTPATKPWEAGSGPVPAGRRSVPRPRRRASPRRS